jgi:hypothetical protein
MSLIHILTAAGQDWRKSAEHFKKALDIDYGLLDDGPPRPWNAVALPSECSQAQEDLRLRVFRDNLPEPIRNIFDQYVDHPIHRIVSRVNKSSDISLKDLKMFAWRAPMPDGLRPQLCFSDDLTGLVGKLKELDHDGTTENIVREFMPELIGLGIIQRPEKRTIGFRSPVAGAE